jgi:NAD(P)-dependent dehydrogenase (short-subunit alcohol dehydrogenase family)
VTAARVILVTGCSSGIGRATALEAARRGHRVFASARNRNDLVELERGADASLSTLGLDVTDPASVRSAVGGVLSRAGRLDALVNNAGYAQYGAVEEVSPEEWRAVFDVNFFGLLDVTRAVLPAMRAAGRGTIVLMSSLGGRVSVPFASPYCASKHAVEAVADALRVEAAPFGIRVVTIEPGPIDTRFTERARSIVGPLIARPGPYRAFYANAEKAMDGDFRRGHLPPERVARIVLDAIESSRPRTRYRVTWLAKTLIAMKRALPDRWIDRMMRFSLKLPAGPG